MLWMWIGGLVMVFGSLFALLPLNVKSTRRVPARQPAPQPAA
jgi:cytochrome c biogenesis factor